MLFKNLKENINIMREQKGNIMRGMVSINKNKWKW